MSEGNTSDTTVGRASAEDMMAFQVFPDSVDCFAKPSRRLPSIVVEPTDVEEVESGELRWPPDDIVCNVTEDHDQVTANQCEGLCDEGKGAANIPVAPPQGQGAESDQDRLSE